MRKLGFFAGVAMLVATTGFAAAQTALEGPLRAPDEPPQTAAKPVKKAQRDKAKHKKVAHRDATQANDGGYASSASAYPRELALPSTGTAPADPMSFGMKWNGNSDNARETRVQNYNGTANGSGAEVGMKLHF